MNIRPVHFLIIFALLSACVPISNSSIEPVEPAASTPVVPSFLLPGERVIMQSASYSLTVRDPIRSLADVRRAVEQAGGFVVSVSSSSGEGSASSSSLSAKVPPESLPALNEAMERIAGEVKNGSMYVQDVTSEVLRLQERHRELTRAQEQIFSWLTQTRSWDADATYRILSGLLDTELKNVKSQLDSYEQQSSMASFDVYLSQPSELTVITD